MLVAGLLAGLIIVLHDKDSSSQVAANSNNLPSSNYPTAGSDPFDDGRDNELDAEQNGGKKDKDGRKAGGRDGDHGGGSARRQGNRRHFVRGLRG